MQCQTGFTFSRHFFHFAEQPFYFLGETGLGKGGNYKRLILSLKMQGNCLTFC